jgi:hypothetical protein
MTKRIAAITLFALAALPLRADFNAVVREVGSHRGLHRVPIPFLGLARFAVWIVHPEGVHDFQLATFEGNAEDVDGSLIGDLLARNAGSGFRPIVRVQSNRRGGEWTFIFARPQGETFELLVATSDDKETTVVRAVVDLDRLQRAVNQSRHGHGNVVASLR